MSSSIIHVGYAVRKRDLPAEYWQWVCPGIQLLDQPIVAVHYKIRKHIMQQWYDHRKYKKFDAHVYGYYHVPRRATVLHVSIDGTQYWITIANEANIKPIRIKEMVAQGELGEKQSRGRFKISNVFAYCRVRV